MKDQWVIEVYSHRDHHWYRALKDGQIHPVNYFVHHSGAERKVLKIPPMPLKQAMEVTKHLTFISLNDKYTPFDLDFRIRQHRGIEIIMGAVL